MALDAELPLPVVGHHELIPRVMHAMAREAGDRLIVARVKRALAHGMGDLMLHLVAPSAGQNLARSPEIKRLARMHRYMALEAFPVLHRSAPDVFQGLLHGGDPLFGGLVAGDAELRLLHGQLFPRRRMITVAHGAAAFLVVLVDVIVPEFRRVVLMTVEAQLLAVGLCGYLPVGGDRVMALFAALAQEERVAVRAEEPLRGGAVARVAR